MSTSTVSRPIDVTATPAHRAPAIAMAVLRIALGFIFLWPFIDKLFGLGYATPAARAWINGGSPTTGFLGHVDAGPFKSLFTSWAGASVLDWLFMLSLLGLGVALIAGVGLRIAAVSGSVLLVLMWAAEWPMARFTESGTPTSSTNPFLDDHLIFALVLIVLALFSAGNTWGLGQWWSSKPFVQRHQWLR